MAVQTRLDGKCSLVALNPHHRNLLGLSNGGFSAVSSGTFDEIPGSFSFLATGDFP
jgi:hypothetical protein